MSDNNTPNISAKYEEERNRSSNQSQISHLQSQIDELRRLLRDQNQKYQLAIEQVRKNDQANADMETQFSRQSQELSQTIEGFRRDIGSLRKEFASTLVKVEDGIQPIRDMQAQIQELGTGKDDRVSVATLINRLAELEQKNGALYALVREADERYRSVVTRLEAFQSAEDTRRAELRKILEEVQIEKQQLRRQAVENQQLVADSKYILSEQQSRLIRLDDFRSQIDKVSSEIPNRSKSSIPKSARIGRETKQIERLESEHYLANQQRIEEIRMQQEEEITSLQDTEERQFRQFTTWIERIDTYVRDLEQRLTRTHNRLENLQHDHANHFNDIEAREIELLSANVKILQTMLERVKSERITQSPTDGKSR
jgi:chromosome segregation ATPase